MTKLETLNQNHSLARTLGELSIQQELFPSMAFRSSKVEISETEIPSKSKSDRFAFANGSISANRPRQSFDKLIFRQASSSCGHLNFTLSTGKHGKSLDWVALRRA